ncbi:hypothetical protein [Pseudovibrio brasiliensis]|uniref:Tetratricopeptide repeat protein n=1 Tax=Pseudovibrio brasiliensis TaxID=1898042 RepID=A0ABX8AL09_9HYPH|nr:hypothetical protein [Pseudovibrio brasiliensis]QUS54369.1 hypothetical protein KGB56_13285 [Pseudovibrio brasiliensis]
MSQAPATQNAPASDELPTDVEVDLDAVFQALGGGDVSARAVLDALRSGQGLSVALNADGKLEKVLYQFAYQALHLQQKASAEEQFKVLCLLNPKNAEYWLGLALSHSSWPLGGDEVETSLRQARLVDEVNPAVALRLAEHWLWSRKLDEATSELVRFYKLMKTRPVPSLIDYSKRLAYALEAQKKAAVRDSDAS